MLFRRLAAALACLTVVAGCTAEPKPESQSDRVADESAVDEFDVTDMTLLQSAWWTWAASAPDLDNPVSDTTGEDCRNNQPEGVWLLAGSFGETVNRQCTVPAGVPLAGPAVNLVAPTAADCADFMRNAEGKVTVDDAPVTLQKADPVSITYRAVDGNPVTVDGGEFESFACGLWFSVPDLESGEHAVVIEGSGDGFALSVTYDLTVSAAT
jgi:hypothetical protein